MLTRRLDRGNSVGEISGHAKPINSIAIRQARPFKAVTGSDDNGVVFLAGVPFKFSRIHKLHSSFVHSVAYSPSGSLFASAGADRKVFLYDGTSGDQSSVLSGHEGSIYAVAFGPDSTSLASASADGTVRLWDAESQKESMKWTLSGGKEQQVGLTWVGETIVSVSATGDLALIDKRQGERPTSISSVSYPSQLSRSTLTIRTGT